MQPSNSHLHQPPRLVSDTHYCVVGDVTVDSTAAIAPGVVLQAPSGSRIIIEKGVCLAGGVCIQSRKGVLKISSGASLGANVLVVGHGAIGANASIGPSSTVIDPQIEQSAVVPPCSLIGQSVAQPDSKPVVARTSFSNGVGINNGAGFSNGAGLGNGASNSYSPNRYQSVPAKPDYAAPPSDTVESTFVEPPPIGPKAVEIPDLSDQNGQFVDPAAAQNSYGGFTNGVQLNQPSSSHSDNGGGLAKNGSSSLTTQSNGYVYGRNQVSQLMSTLFPNRPSSKDS